MDWLSDPGYWASRLVFTRGLALTYLIAFVVALRQFRPLVGTAGMLPVPDHLARTPFRRAPSLFHLHWSDRFFAGVCWVGIAGSAAALAGLVDRAPLEAWIAVWALLWALYLSIVNVGQTWYGFGWESLLLEAGFLAIWLGPADVAPPVLVLWLLRWLLFRLEFGAGLIKLRGDRCWRDLTCLRYHHETQPMPNPASWWFHHLPPRWHTVETLGNHATQLVVVWGLLLPQPVATVAALVVIATQAYLVLSGNFSWLNWLALVLATSAVDGRVWAAVLPVDPPADLAAPPTWHAVLVVVVTAGLLALSWRPARNLVSRNQLMNASFDPLHLVNTYGAFGSVTRTRYEVVVEGTDDPAAGPEAVWQEYEFRGKPGDVRRRPPQVAPYHLRLDWLMWFVAIDPGYGGRWLPAFLRLLLEGDPATLRLLRRSPFPPGSPPAFVRLRLFRYRFTTRQERRATGAWWSRAPVAVLVDPVSLDRLRTPSR
ncbi:lipase maturation factor family protein [Geodermatophilus sp. YIM 151500]|uniref:lipase maturation factor family protein n=1 Tax=Geodermatophilus sp. YIM 151500 TaxID=2984531 RepID=UPI0021E3A21D|nr:lipase maturation factor family protein [Geodermatophilus sp. YIM 151500]MCV2489333.1 lipase maturation factor family protein [Geodermatophilus sp. YIM 151500]